MPNGSPDVTKIFFDFFPFSYLHDVSHVAKSTSSFGMTSLKTKHLMTSYNILVMVFKGTLFADKKSQRE